jgi:hypothetical protein
MKELGNAINESLSESDQIAEAITEIRKEGYDVFLVLEATIGFNKRQEDGTSEPDVADRVGLADEDPAEVPFTTQDEKFLRALKITIDE